MQKNDVANKWEKYVDGLRYFNPFGPISYKTNELGNYHADNEPAWISPTRVIWFKDGKRHGPDIDIWGSITYYYENIMIPKKYYVEPENVTLQDILQETNLEIRYVGLKLLSYEKLTQSGKVIDYNEKGYELIEVEGVFSTPVKVLKCVNSTPEIDGTYKIYLLFVPPEMTTCQDAVAWTFYLDAKTYNPIYET